MSAPGYERSGKVGQPDLPVLRRNLEIPFGASYSIEVISSRIVGMSFQGIPHLALRTVPQPSSKCSFQSDEFKTEVFAPSEISGIYPDSLVSVEGDVVIRGHRVLQLELHPVRFNSATGEIELVRDLKFNIILSGSDMEKTINEAERLKSCAFSDFLETETLNFNQGLPTKETRSGERILIVSAERFVEPMATFVDLKASQGFNVSLVSLSTTGATPAAIQNYIKTQYLSPHPPVYVLLVGDHAATDVQARLDSWPMKSDSTHLTDLYYFTMDGNEDTVPDLLYGRFPVQNVTQLQAIIAKYSAYNELQGNEDWIKKASFLATDDATFHSVAEEAHDFVIDTYTGPQNYIGSFPYPEQEGGDKIYAFSSPTAGQDSINAINANRSIVVYSGHGSSTAWSAPSVTANQVRALKGIPVPYVASYSCRSNDFTTPESFADTWMIQANHGALSFFGPSADSYWNEDRLLQKHIFADLFQDFKAIHVPSVGTIGFAGLWSINSSPSSLSNYYWQAYQLFGDPSLQIITKRMDMTRNVFLPQIMNNVVANDPQTVQNPDFELGQQVWESSSSNRWDLIVKNGPGAITPFSGQWMAWMGGANDEVSVLSQTIHVPLEARAPVLSFNYWVASEDACGNDFMRLFINDTFIGRIDLCSGSQTYRWTRLYTELQNYAGEDINVKFYVSTNASLNSNFMLDDVFLLPFGMSATVPEKNQMMRLLPEYNN